MIILSDEQYQLLTFIAACNRNSYRPTAAEVMLWWENPEPIAAEYKTVTVPPVVASPVGPQVAGVSTRSLFSDFAPGDGSSLAKMISTMFGDRWIAPVARGLTASLFEPHTRRELVKPAETTLEYLVRLTWLAEDDSRTPPGLHLTELGRALLRDRDLTSAPPEDVNVVVFEVEDPLAYPQLVGQLANAGEGLLIDPYLKLDDLHRIVVSTRLTRLLVADVRSNRHVVASMQTYLDSPSLGRRVEVRMSKKLHDRLLIAEDGSVLTLGSSLNGIGHKLTVLSPIPPNQCEIFRDTYDEIWESAELVGPASEGEGADNTESDAPGPSDPRHAHAPDQLDD
ncbi:hypothetical protein O4159_18875 [Gordonia terrae]|uniref:Uncharacterized protein n=1 Tax=Gordonia rubripertincta TaxID=36822 RepID=A0AAW6RFR9_GORRU|nr:hypothetical protein [Gordonia rubripertincta]MCZ4537479.1 hypothetical protein [Gordonia terrae]MDG6782940.1 hypothetical protein [Gordonia rubripertincta]